MPTSGPAAEHFDYLDDPDHPVGPHQGEVEDEHRSPDEEDTHVAD